ncbi:MAG TPA: M48 family metalloprotease [Solirubrobacteraceae bacterium]|jgi:STE24 endopeptidase
MPTAHRTAFPRPRARRRRRRQPGATWPLALAGALATASLAALALRPAAGLIEPDPVDVLEYFSRDDIARARRFGRPQLALHGAATLVQAGVLAALVARPSRRGAASEHPLAHAALAGAGLSLAVGLAPLPLRALARVRALKVGLATQSWRGWAGDLAKGSALEAGFAAAAAPVGIALMRRWPRLWWLPGAGVLVAGTAGMTLLAPVLVDPLFNSYTPLPDGPVRDDVLALAARAGVRVGEVYEVDASRRTSAANAYVTGLGPTKRVVLFDTLLREFTPAETRLVVAHELAHVRHRDVPRSLAALALSAPGAMYAAATLTRRLSGGAAAARPGAPVHATAPRAGAPHGSARLQDPPLAGPATLPALALSLGLVAAAIGSVWSALSRRVEARADAFSLALTDEPQPFVGFERRIVRQNLADPDPPRWLVRLLASHPPAVQRIGIARAYARGVRPGGPGGR